MSHQSKRSTTETRPPKSHGWMAEFSDEHHLLDASRKVRDAGYTATDAFTPFPVHGIDEALGIKPTILPFIVLCMGALGTATALLMQWWMNGVSYPYIISGKPLGITPASIPVTFELTVLFAAFTSVLGMIALNGLPRFSNPVFTSARFDRATNDKFFLYVNAKDKYYNRDSVKELLSSTQPESLDEVLDDTSSTTVPKPILLGALLIVLIGLIPTMIVLNMRASYSELPRWHVFFDMDFQPKKKPQQTTTIFADGRSMRPQAKGTIARGQLTEQDPYYLGYDPSKVAAIVDRGAVLVHSVLDQPPEEAKPQEAKPETTKPDDAKPDQDGKPAAPAAAAAGPNLPWIGEIPIEASEENMKLGKTKFEIYCSACHGYAGFGDGLVAKRAASLMQDTWTPPTSLHADRVQKQAVGQIFYTITNGQGKMASYGTTINPKERWAIVLYVKALQRSRNASMDDIPVERRSSLSTAP